MGDTSSTSEVLINDNPSLRQYGRVLNISQSARLFVDLGVLWFTVEWQILSTVSDLQIQLQPSFQFWANYLSLVHIYIEYGFRFSTPLQRIIPLWEIRLDDNQSDYFNTTLRRVRK